MINGPFLMILEAFISIFFFLGLGFVYQRFRPFEESTLRRLSGIVADVFLPLFLFYLMAVETDLKMLSMAPVMILLGVAIPIGSYFLATAAARPLGIPDQSRSAFRYGTMVGNTTFIGIPVCEALFGPIGVMYAVLYDFGTSIVSLTVGIWELQGGKLRNIGHLFYNPLLIGVVLGLVFALFGWKIPAWMDRPFEMVSGVTLPLALFLTGIQVGSIKSSEVVSLKHIGGQSALKLVAEPLLVLGVLYLIGWNDIPAKVVVVEAGMPVGLITAILARNYGADAKFASAMVFWSTLACFLTLPLLSPFLLLW